MNQAKREGWRLVILDLGLDLGTPQGRLMANVIAAIAEFESGLISERTADAMAAGKERGASYGRVRLAPPGLVRRIVMSRNAGASFGSIARELTAESVLSPTGRPTWQESTVRRIYNSTQEAA